MKSFDYTQVRLGSLGQWISAFARLYAAGGDSRDRDKAIFLIDEFWKCHDILKGTDKALLHSHSFYAFP